MKNGIAITDFFLTHGVETDQTAASSAGSLNSIFSSRPGSTDTATGPIRRNASITSSTSTSGAEAPAVIPTVAASLELTAPLAEPLGVVA